jgi:hypothetical protein
MMWCVILYIGPLDLWILTHLKLKSSRCYCSEMEKKGTSKNAFDSLSDIKPGRDTWRIQARVLRLWRVPAFLNPKDTNSIEIVLIDEKVL